MVEVLRQYSNCSGLVRVMIDLMGRIEENDQTDEPGVVPTGPGGGHVPVRQRLSEAELSQLVADRRAGATMAQLVVRYGISRSSVKRVLRSFERNT